MTPPLKIIAKIAFSVALALFGCSYVIRAFLGGYTVPPENLPYIAGMTYVTSAWVLLRDN